MMLLNLCADQTLDESLLFCFTTFWREFEPIASEINVLSANISELMWQKIYLSHAYNSTRAPISCFLVMTGHYKLGVHGVFNLCLT